MFHIFMNIHGYTTKFVELLQSCTKYSNIFLDGHILFYLCTYCLNIFKIFQYNIFLVEMILLLCVDGE